jgi:anaerobic ribonucleoside-triphosphate reductase activating protein
MSDEIRISGIVEESIVDGPGLRYVLFTQGCPHHCKGCHNPTTHPFDGGRMVSPDWVFADVRKNPIVRGVTFSGGEPFVQSGKLAPLAERLRAAGYNLTSYTGYLYEELLADSRHMPLLRQLDPCGRPLHTGGEVLDYPVPRVAQPTYHRRAPLIGGRPRGAPPCYGLSKALLRFREGFFLCLESPSGGADILAGVTGICTDIPFMR